MSRTKINYVLYAKILEQKQKHILPPNVTINYEHLGRVLEAKYNEI